MTLSLTGLFALSTSSVALACENGALGSSIRPHSGLSAQPQASGAHVPAPWDNVGTYSYSDAQGAFLLTDSWHDPTIVSQPFQLLPGDLVDPPFLPPVGGSGGGVSPPAGESQPQSCFEPEPEPGRLDPIIVTANPPIQRLRFFTRIFAVIGGVVRNVVRPTVTLEHIEIQPQILTCSSARDDLYFSVYEAVRGGEGTGFAVAGLFLVQYSPGHRQWWSCSTAPLSTCGLGEASGCSVDPPRPAP